MSIRIGAGNMVREVRVRGKNSYVAIPELPPATASRYLLTLHRAARKRAVREPASTQTPKLDNYDDLLRRYINVPSIATPISVAAWLPGSGTAVDFCLPSRFLKKNASS